MHGFRSGGMRAAASAPEFPSGHFVLLTVQIMSYSRESQSGGYQGKRKNTIKRAPKRDPIYIDGQAPRPMYVDYKDLDLLSKLTNRHGRIVSRRKTGCHAASQHAVARAIKRARFMALLPYVGD
jgi:small subunit ribosomal protein S18